MGITRTNRRVGASTLRDVSERVELSAPLTIVVTDIVGSTALARRLGDLAYAAVIEDFRAAVRSCVHEFDGREYAHTGDGFIHLYDSATDAIAGALAIFRSNDRLNPRRAEALALRGGIHCGRLVRSSTGPIGVALNEACEIGQNAIPGELWLSSAANETLDRCGGSGEVVDLPKSGRCTIHKVAWARSQLGPTPLGHGAPEPEDSRHGSSRVRATRPAHGLGRRDGGAVQAVRRVLV